MSKIFKGWRAYIPVLNNYYGGTLEVPSNDEATLKAIDEILVENMFASILEILKIRIEGYTIQDNEDGSTVLLDWVDKSYKSLEYIDATRFCDDTKALFPDEFVNYDPRKSHQCVEDFLKKVKK